MLLGIGRVARSTNISDERDFNFKTLNLNTTMFIRYYRNYCVLNYTNLIATPAKLKMYHTTLCKLTIFYSNLKWVYIVVYNKIFIQI